MTKKPHFFTSKNPQYANVSIGAWTYGNPKILSWNDESKLTIGKFCSISANVTVLLGGNHQISWVTTYPLNMVLKSANSYDVPSLSKGDVIIGNDVWIGYNVLILSGVKIGDGAIIGAGSVVTKDVEPYSIVGGNPARHIRHRFPKSVIEDLLRIAWWNWPTEEIEKSWTSLLSHNITDFVEKFKKP